MSSQQLGCAELSSWSFSQHKESRIFCQDCLMLHPPYSCWKPGIAAFNWISTPQKSTLGFMSCDLILIYVYLEVHQGLRPKKYTDDYSLSQLTTSYSQSANQWNMDRFAMWIKAICSTGRKRIVAYSDLRVDSLQAWEQLAAFLWISKAFCKCQFTLLAKVTYPPIQDLVGQRGKEDLI